MSRRTTSRWHERADGRDRGSTTVEAAGYTVLMLLALTVLVQAAVWGLADLSARQAAQHGVQTARVAGGTEQAGHTDTEAMLRAINARGITDVNIAVQRGPDTTTVTITGTVLQVVPGVSIPVHARAQAPTEPDG
jgi:hypothetical protein